MDAAELLRKVRKIEIKTRRSCSLLFSGEYHSAFRGQGMSFSEVREYQPGDDIRSIDWNVSARLNHTYVKVFEEERELNVVLMVDASRSSFFGTTHQLKQDLMMEICALLSYSAAGNHDKISLMFFTDKVEKFLPPIKGHSQVLRIVRELINFTPASAVTDLAEALHFLNNMMKHRSVVFILSDFMSGEYEDALMIAARKHDVICVHVYDAREREIPDVGILPVCDAESGERFLLDTSSRAARADYRNQFEQYQHYFNSACSRNGCDTVTIRTGDDYISKLMALFRQRAKRV